MRRAAAFFLASLGDLFRFYPLQLPFFQLRRHFLLTLFWLVLWAIALGEVGQGLGVPDIFYNNGPPATWGRTFAWGVAFALFVIAHHLTTFLLDGHHAGFLLRERYPFLQYALNNSLLPLLLWTYYLHRYTQQHIGEANLLWQLFGHAVGAIGVTSAALLFLSVTSQDIFRLRKAGLLSPQAVYHQVLQAQATSPVVRYYLAWPKGIVATHRGITLDRKTLAKLLFQQHRNAFLLEVVLLVGIGFWGYVQQKTEVYLPAGAAFLVLWAILYMLIGAVSFWVRQWGGWALIALLVIGIGILRSSWLRGTSPAYGLSGKGPLQQDATPDYTADSLALVQCLEGWSHRQEKKAPLVWIQVSGGGWRSAFWSLSNLQLIDSLSGGKLWQRTFAISGASGGLIGAALWRDIGLYYPHRRWDLREPFQLTQDALDPILSTGLVGLLSPIPTFYDSLTHTTYPQGRGYAFERALVRNARAFYDRTLAAYTQPERTGQCPLLFITPALLPSARLLLISSQPCSPLTRQGLLVELRARVPHAENLYLRTALRMNASFPFVLPSVSLPTAPPMEAIDAGAIDNHGELIALQFLWEMREAIARHASKVILIELRDLPVGLTHSTERPTSALSETFQRISGLYVSFAGARQLFTQVTYEVLTHAYPIPVEKYTLAFTPPQGRIPPLGFTLRAADQAYLLEALLSPTHQKKLAPLLDALK